MSEEQISWKSRDWFSFDPLSSITAYEVAQILKTLEMKIDKEALDNLPKDLRRHFRQSKVEYFVYEGENK